MKNNKVVLDLFKELRKELDLGNFVKDKSGSLLVEKLMAVLVLDPSDHIIDLGAKKTNEEYVKLETEWYDGQSLNVDKVASVASIWNNICSDNREVNSNYGYLVYSRLNHFQFDKCAKALLEDRSSRRAIMIYNRPSMHEDFKRDGMNDFICTLSHQFFIRCCHLVVQ